MPRPCWAASSSGDASPYTSPAPHAGPRTPRRTRRVPHRGRRRRRPGDRTPGRRHPVLLQQRLRRHHPRHRQRLRRLRRQRPRPGTRRAQGLHPRRNQLRFLRADAQEAAGNRTDQVRRRGLQGPLRAHRAVPPGTLRDHPRPGTDLLRGGHGQVRHRRRLRHLQADHRQHPGQPEQRLRPGRRPRHPAGHQRPRPGQHAEGRHLLGGAAHRRRRDHPARSSA